IAGDDDLDAPDLGGHSVEGTAKPGNGCDPKRQSGNGADQQLGNFAAGRKPWSPPRPPLEPKKSAVLRDRLLGEISVLASQSEATAWAHKAMSAKNTLGTADSGLVETAFSARSAALADDSEALHRSAFDADTGSFSGASSEDSGRSARVNNAVAWHIDKGAL